jgi:hypothetical protein
MSSPPPPYTRYFDFTSYQASNPSTPLPGASIDQEYNRIQTSINATETRLGLIQRDDGALQNAIVTQASLAPDVWGLFSAAGVPITPGTPVQFAQVGIGMVPVNILDITQSVNYGAEVSLLNPNPGGNANARFQASNGSRYGALVHTGTGFAGSGIYRTDATMVEGTGLGGLTLSAAQPQPIYFATNLTERMRLDAAGNLGIGMVPSYPLSVHGNGTVLQLDGAATGNGVIRFTKAGADPACIMGIDISGNTMVFPAAANAMIFRSDSGPVCWSTGGSGAEKMRLDLSGNLVVGNPSAINSNPGRGNISVNGSAGAIFALGIGGVSTGYVFTDGLLVTLASVTNIPVRVAVNGVESARWETDGSFLVGTSAAGGTIGAKAALWASTSGAAPVQMTYQIGTGFAHTWRCDSASAAMLNMTFNGLAQIGSISITGGGTGVAYNTSSDARLKANIVDAPDTGAIIDGLRVRSWDWTVNGEHEAYGFVAQEEATVAPFAVVQGDPGTDPANIEKPWARDDTKLVPLLVKEIQSLRARVAVLEGKS